MKATLLRPNCGRHVGPLGEQALGEQVRAF